MLSYACFAKSSNVSRDQVYVLCALLTRFLVFLVQASTNSSRFDTKRVHQFTLPIMLEVVGTVFFNAKTFQLWFNFSSAHYDNKYPATNSMIRLFHLKFWQSLSELAALENLLPVKENTVDVASFFDWVVPHFHATNKAMRSPDTNSSVTLASLSMPDKFLHSSMTTLLIVFLPITTSLPVLWWNLIDLLCVAFQIHYLNWKWTWTSKLRKSWSR